jgi:hypothetical protein
MIAVGSQDGVRSGRYWIPGALCDKDIYLFDTRLGMPLPGPGGKGIATLKQVREQPAILNALNIDEKHRYDVTAQEAKSLEVHVAPFLSAMAPRMTLLETLLATQNKVSVAVEPGALLERFRTATQGQKIPLHIWNTPGEPNSPMTVLRRFLPPEEGGIDKARRRPRAEAELVPWNALPELIARGFPSDTELGRRLRTIFQKFFVAFMLDPKPTREAERQRLAKVSTSSPRDENSGDSALGPLVLLTSGSRDEMVHGRYEEATVPLVELRDELRKLKSLVQNDPALQEQLLKWSEDFRGAYADLLRAERTSHGDRQGVQAARARVAGLWAKNEGPLTALMLGSASEPLGGVTTYFLALCKHEQAERLQVKADHAGPQASAEAARAAAEAWKGAADWWETYLTENTLTVWTPTARSLRARALASMGNKEGAASLLEDLTGNVSDLEQLGRLYRARELRK